MDINNFLNGIDKEKLMQAMKKVTSSAEGQELVKKLQNIDKNELMKNISSIDDSKVSKEQLFKELTTNPNLVDKLKNIINKKR